MPFSVHCCYVSFPYSSAIGIYPWLTFLVSSFPGFLIKIERLEAAGPAVIRANKNPADAHASAGLGRLEGQTYKIKRKSACENGQTRPGRSIPKPATPGSSRNPEPKESA